MQQCVVAARRGAFQRRQVANANCDLEQLVQQLLREDLDCSFDRQLLSKGVARVRLDLWRVAEPWLEQAQDDATIVAIRDMERAGIDIVTDGEMRRESYSNRFATSLEGIASSKPGEVISKAGNATAVPRVVGFCACPAGEVSSACASSRSTNARIGSPLG